MIPSHLVLKGDPLDSPAFRGADIKDVLELDKQSKADARQAHAYVNTDRWREAVIRTYSFLDAHSDVDDVVVFPVACHNHVSTRIFGGIVRGFGGSDVDINRAKIVGRDEAESVLSSIGASLPPASDKSTVFVPFVGGGSLVYPAPGTLPSAWMTVHSLFDDDATSLSSCGRVMRELTGILGKDSLRLDGNNDISIPSLLFNCGWAKNAFNMVVAASGSKERSVRQVRSVLDADVIPPAVGKRYKSPSDVRVKSRSWSSGDFYVVRPVSDLVAEAMTIAATKPEGFQPVLSRLSQIPDSILWRYVANRPNSSDSEIASMAEKYSGSSPELSAAERATIEASIKRDMEMIKRLTSNVRDLLAQDVVGKVVLLLVH